MYGASGFSFGRCSPLPLTPTRTSAPRTTARRFCPDTDWKDLETVRKMFTSLLRHAGPWISRSDLRLHISRSYSPNFPSRTRFWRVSPWISTLLIICRMLTMVWWQRLLRRVSGFSTNHIADRAVTNQITERAMLECIRIIASELTPCCPTHLVSKITSPKVSTICLQPSSSTLLSPNNRLSPKIIHFRIRKTLKPKLNWNKPKRVRCQVSSFPREKQTTWLVNPMTNET